MQIRAHRNETLPADLRSRRSARFFWTVTRFARPIVALGIVLLVLLALPLPSLYKDTRSDAFLPADHPSLVQRDRVKEVFGLGPSVAVAVVSEREDGIYDPAVLELVRSLTRELEAVPGVDPERITSLSTEDDIRASREGLEIVPLLEEQQATAQDTDRVRKAVERTPAWQGSLVARDGSATLVVAEMLRDASPEDVYRGVREKVESLAHSDREQLHVAGDGALTGYLSSYIDSDAQRLNPLAALIIMLVLVIAHRTRRGVFLPLMLTLSTLAAAIGLMAFMEVPFFLITNGMLVLLIGISVADGIHIVGQYYEEIAQRPEAGARELVVRTMVAMWRPVAVTSVTDAAGFLALALASFMPPMRWFGFFAAVGVMAALVFSMTVLPAQLSLLRPRPSPAFRHDEERLSGMAADRWGALTGRAGRVVVEHPTAVLVVGLIVVVSGVFAATRIQIDEETVRYFHPDEPIRIADTAINETLDGTHYIDVVLESDQPEWFYEPRALETVERLGAWLESDPRVRGVSSLVDVVKQVHRSLEEDRPEAYRLPDSADLVAQSMLLVEMSARPGALEELIDAEARRVLLRARLGSSRFSRVESLFESLDDYLTREVRSQGLQAAVSGRVEVNSQWMSRLRSSHFGSLALALLAVWVFVTLCFRSLTLGTFAVVPVVVAVLFIYSVMGVLGIWLAIGTTMFAAISIGTAVDFAVHTVDRIRQSVRRGAEIEDAIAGFFETTGRALLFNVTAMVLGFSALTFSQVPSLVQFGGLVAVAVAASFLGSVTLLPAALVRFRPAALRGEAGWIGERAAGRVARRAASFAGVLVLPGLVVVGTPVRAEDASSSLPDGLEVATRINQRDDGARVDQTIRFTLESRGGGSQTRTARALREDDDEGVRRRILVYEEPSRVRGTALLTWDYPEREDDQWLYLPAMRKVRRISASNRGDSFLGTDFTYEEMKNGTRVAIDDHEWTTLRRASDEDSACRSCLVVEAVPRTSALARELGYSRIELWIDTDLWIARRSDYWDSRGNPSKTVLVLSIRNIDGYLTPLRYEASDLKSGHRSLLEITRIDYPDDVPDNLFTQGTLRRGL